MAAYAQQLRAAQAHIDNACDCCPGHAPEPKPAKRAPMYGHDVRMILREAKGRPQLRTTYAELDKRTGRATGKRTHREPDPLYRLRVLRLNAIAPAWPPFNARNTPSEAQAAWESRQVAYGAAVSDAYDPVVLP